MTLPTSDDFGIEHLHPYNIVGQHGGELLLEIQDSCFERTCEIDENDQSTLVFGAMCVGTQVIIKKIMVKSKVFANFCFVSTRLSQQFLTLIFFSEIPGYLCLVIMLHSAIANSKQHHDVC